MGLGSMALLQGDARLLLGRSGAASRWLAAAAGAAPVVLAEEVKAAALDHWATKVGRVKGHDTPVNLGLYPTLTPPRSARRPNP